MREPTRAGLEEDNQVTSKVKRCLLNQLFFVELQFVEFFFLYIYVNYIYIVLHAESR